METNAMTQPQPHQAMGYFYHVEFGLLRRCLLTGKPESNGSAQWLIITPAEIIFLPPTALNLAPSP